MNGCPLIQRSEAWSSIALSYHNVDRRLSMPFCCPISSNYPEEEEEEALISEGNIMFTFSRCLRHDNSNQIILIITMRCIKIISQIMKSTSRCKSKQIFV